MLKPLPPASIVSELLRYDPNTGEFYWNTRPQNYFVPTEKRTAEWLCRWWNTRFANTPAGTVDPNGYTIIRVLGTDYRAHRLAWLLTHGTAPEFIDHEDGDRGNNRVNNLKSVSHEENTKNAKRRCDNNSGVTGVGFYPNKNKWRARINYHGKTILLGYFGSKEEAIAARKAAEIVYEYHKNHGR